MKLFRNREEATSPVERMRAAPLQLGTAGEDLAFVRRSGSTEGADAVPMFVADFLEQCREFLPLEEHLASFLEYHEWSGLQAEGLRSWLPKLREAGYFVTEAELFAQVTGSGGENGGCGIAVIGVPTANRPIMLARVLESFSANLAEHGRALPFVIADSSADPKVAQENAEVAARARARGGEVRFFDATKKREVIDRLESATGVERSILEFALLDPEGCGFACGANRNLLLLSQAGRAYATVDDDVLCEFGRPEEPSEALTIFGGMAPYERRYFGSRREVFEKVTSTEADYIGLHQTLLGRTAAEAVGQFAAVTTGKVSEAVMEQLQGTDLRVRLSFAGHYGDSSLATTCYQLFGPEDDLLRLTVNEASYEAAMGSRSSAVVSPGWSIGDFAASPGMGMALDARTILPPFFPVFHLEDVVFGQTVSLCCRQALAAHLPLAIRHDPAAEPLPVRPCDLPGVPSVIFEFAQLLREVQGSFTGPPGEATPEAVMTALGRHFSELGAVPEKDFDEYLRALVFRAGSRSVSGCDQMINRWGHLASFWRRDMEAWRDHIRGSLLEPDFDIPRELKTRQRDAAQNRRLMQRLLSLYGNLLMAWPSIWQAAGRLEWD